jgi:hypothetical protein
MRQILLDNNAYTKGVAKNRPAILFSNIFNFFSSLIFIYNSMPLK